MGIKKTKLSFPLYKWKMNVQSEMEGKKHE